MNLTAKTSSGQSSTSTILMLVAFVQIVLIGFIYFPKLFPTKSEVGNLLDIKVKVNDIIGLEISDGEEQINLARDGDNWILPEAGDFPVELDKLDPLLDKLVNLSTENLVADNKVSHKRLEVADDEFVRKVTIRLKGSRNATLLIGSSPAASATHVRLKSKNAVYLSRDLRSSDANVVASSWIDTQYFGIESDDVVSLELKNEHGDFNFEKVSDNWELIDSDEEIDESALNSLVRKASSIRMVRPLGKEAKEEYGLDEPTATVSIVTRAELEPAESTEESEEEKAEAKLEAQTYTLTVGNELDDGFVVKASESEYYVVISNSNASDFVKKKREDFIVEPEEEEVTDDSNESLEEEDSSLESESDEENVSDAEISEESDSDTMIDEESVLDQEVSEGGASGLEANQEEGAEASEENLPDSGASEQTIPD